VPDQRLRLEGHRYVDLADGIATATISSGHAYRPFQVVEIAGAEQPEYNGSSAC
jgi:hypothetical protein